MDAVEDAVEDAVPDADAHVLVSDALANAFQSHVAALQAKRRKRKARLQLRGVAESVDGGDGGSGGGGRSGGVGGGDGAAGEAGATGAANDGLQGGSGEIDGVLSHESDAFEGDGMLRTLYALLARIDERGYSRSRQQLQFHNAFVRACSRVLYRSDWASNRPAIMHSNGWEKCPSEILISTPRRFGKTFRCVSSCSATCFLTAPPPSPLPVASL